MSGKLTLLKKGNPKFYKDGTKKVKYDSESLKELSDVEFSEDMEPKERLRTMIKMLDGMLPVAHGLFKANPRAGTAYAINALMDRMQSILEQLETGLDMEHTAKHILKEIIHKNINSIILELGKLLYTELKVMLPYLDKNGKKKMKLVRNNILRKFGVLVEDKHSSIKTDLVKYLIKIN